MASPPTSPSDPSALGSTEQVSFGDRDVAAADKAGLVRQVFESVAPRYDLMNDLMSGGVHRLWKNTLVDVLNPRPGKSILDVAGGTGDVALRIVRRQGERPDVTVCDINAAMLAVGRDRALDRGAVKGVTWIAGDAQALPFPERSFDGCTIAFGLRNVTLIDKALAEAYRVLRPGGRFWCLEFSKVTSPSLARLYDGYSSRALPLLGRVVAGDADSYRYLARKHPPLSGAAAARRTPAARRLLQRALAQPLDGHRRPARRLAHLTMLRALRNFWRLLRLALSLARHDALFPLEIIGIAPAVVRVGARCLARRGRLAPARPAAGGRPAGDGPLLHQARPGAVDPGRPPERGSRCRSRAPAGPSARLSRHRGAPHDRARARPADREAVLCASTTCRWRRPRSRRFTSPSPATAARSRSRCCGPASSTPSSATSISSTGSPSWSSARSRVTAG